MLNECPLSSVGWGTGLEGSVSWEVALKEEGDPRHEVWVHVRPEVLLLLACSSLFSGDYSSARLFSQGGKVGSRAGRTLPPSSGIFHSTTLSRVPAAPCF